MKTDDRRWNNHSDGGLYISTGRSFIGSEVVTEGDGSPANKRIPLVQQDHRTRYPALVAFYLPPKCKIFSWLLIGWAEGERKGEEKSRGVGGRVCKLDGVAGKVPEVASTSSIYCVRGKSNGATPKEDGCRSFRRQPSFTHSAIFSHVLLRRRQGGSTRQFEHCRCSWIKYPMRDICLRGPPTLSGVSYS